MSVRVVKKLIEEVDRLIELVTELNYRLSAVIDDVEKLKEKVK